MNGSKDTPSAATESSFLGVVLAGGRSRRMGEDKARLCLAGVPLVTVMARRLRDAGALRVVVSGDYRDLGHECVPDDTPGGGPVAGLRAVARAFGSSSNGKVIVAVPVDMPGLSPETLALLGSTRERAACFAESFLPLALRLEEELLPRLQPGGSVGALLHTLGARKSPAPRPAELLNLNTPAEWRAFSRAPKNTSAVSTAVSW